MTPPHELPGWYVHDNALSGLHVYLVNETLLPSYGPTPRLVAWIAGQPHPVEELVGDWYGPLDLQSYVAVMQALRADAVILP
jgi:hypothetical protein